MNNLKVLKEKNCETVEFYFLCYAWQFNQLVNYIKKFCHFWTPCYLIVSNKNTSSGLLSTVKQLRICFRQRTDAETTDFGNRMVMHQVEVRANSSLHISVYEWINRTTNGTNESKSKFSALPSSSNCLVIYCLSNRHCITQITCLDHWTIFISTYKY